MNPTPLVPSHLLRRDEAAQHIQGTWGYPCSPRTLAKYAVIGGGPVFRRAGRFPLYSTDDLDAWITSKLSPPMRSTSDVASPTDRTTDSYERSELADEKHVDHGPGETSNARERGRVA
jgi:hypothetical protein